MWSWYLSSCQPFPVPVPFCIFQVPHSQAGLVWGLLVTPHTPHTRIGEHIGMCPSPAAGSRHTGYDPWWHSSLMPVLSLSHSSLMAVSLASSCFWGHTPFLLKCLGPRPHLLQRVAQRLHWLQGVTPQVRQGCPTPLSRFPLLLPQKWHLCPCSTHIDTEMSWGWSSPNLCLELLNGAAIIAWRLLVFTIVFIIYPLSTWFVLVTLSPSLISFHTEKPIDQISLHVLAFHVPLQKSIQWIPENEKSHRKWENCKVGVVRDKEIFEEKGKWYF